MTTLDEQIAQLEQVLLARMDEIQARLANMQKAMTELELQLRRVAGDPPDLRVVESGSDEDPTGSS